MKKVTPNGREIKSLREELEKGSTQKEMVHALKMSERSLRMIENENMPVEIVRLRHIATYLGVTPERIAYSIDAPKLVLTPAKTSGDLRTDLSADRLVPRFDKDLAYATMDAKQLLNDARHSHDMKVGVDVELNEETATYVEELVRLLSALTWSERDWATTSAPGDDIAIQRRVRNLLVLLKGNDVWVYQAQHLRRLPERFTEAPVDEPHDVQFRLALAFAPPGEYGETSVWIDVDNGQPSTLKGWRQRESS